MLDLLQHFPSDVDAALVSGASIAPQDEATKWEMPRLPLEDPEWMEVINEDAQIVGVDQGQEIASQSFAFTFNPPDSSRKQLPPVLVMVGEHDISMAKRDFPMLVERAKACSGSDLTEGRVLEGAWHNHSIDVPENFAEVINGWNESVFEGQRASS